MSYTVKLYGQNTIELIVEQGANLFQCISNNVPEFYAPCGGNGTCGKCRVNIIGEGYVTSCLYHVSKNIEVLLPEKVEMKVLSSQYALTKDVILEPGKTVDLVSAPLGLAIDIGTTTLVYYIVNLLSGAVVNVRTSINPQLKYGADVISRINFSDKNKKGVEILQSSLINAINKTIEEYCSECKIAQLDFVKVSIVGNTTMLHTLLGINTLSIAHTPFTPSFTDAKTVSAKSIGIAINNDAELVLSPSLSAYVGADIIAGLASIDTTKLDKTYLFVDIGTNGEIVLVSPNKILACATAAGPAFEGANISCGMGATIGAISAYKNLDLKVIGNVEPAGVCGSGLIEIVASMLEKSVLQSDGNITEDFVVYENSPKQNTIVLKQQDIREVQLAKSAIAAGIKRLLALAGITVNELDHVLLAGGFGSYINIKSAIHIGLLPDLALNKYIQTGNTAGSGAVLALKSEKFVEQMEALKSKMENVELSTDSDFAMEYAMNMFF